MVARDLGTDPFLHLTPCEPQAENNTAVKPRVMLKAIRLNIPSECFITSLILSLFEYLLMHQVIINVATITLLIWNWAEKFAGTV